MTNSEDEDHQYSIVDLVDDAVVASAHTPLAMPANELLGASRAGLLGKQLDDSLNPALRMAVQLT
mgnify:CR=1 FL=1